MSTPQLAITELHRYPISHAKLFFDRIQTIVYWLRCKSSSLMLTNENIENIVIGAIWQAAYICKSAAPQSEMSDRSAIQNYIARYGSIRTDDNRYCDTFTFNMIRLMIRQRCRHFFITLHDLSKSAAILRIHDRKYWLTSNSINIYRSKLEWVFTNTTHAYRDTNWQKIIYFLYVLNFINNAEFTVRNLIME